MARSRVGSTPPLTINPSIAPEVQRSLRRVETSLAQLNGRVTNQSSEIAQKFSTGDLATITSYVRNQLQANGSHPLSITSLPGQTAQPQQASIPLYNSLPANAVPNTLSVVNGQLYRYGPGGWMKVGLYLLMDTHANRLADYPPANYPLGTLFLETDTDNLLVDTGSDWTQTSGGSTDDTLIEVNGSMVGQAGVSAAGLVIGFVMNTGATGTNVGPMLPAPHLGNPTQCVVIVKASDASNALTFQIKQNGTPIFTAAPSLAAGTAAGTVRTFTTLTSSPLAVNRNDVFTMDISSGTSAWQFTAQLE